MFGSMKIVKRGLIVWEHENSEKRAAVWEHENSEKRAACFGA